MKLLRMSYPKRLVSRILEARDNIVYAKDTDAPELIDFVVVNEETGAMGYIDIIVTTSRKLSADIAIQTRFLKMYDALDDMPVYIVFIDYYTKKIYYNKWSNMKKIYTELSLNAQWLIYPLEGNQKKVWEKYQTYYPLSQMKEIYTLSDYEIIEIKKAEKDEQIKNKTN